MEHSDFDKVRASVQQQCGSEVVIQLDRGRNKVDIQKGVIQEAYPSVFTILVDDEAEDHPAQLLSFSYTDIITKEIRMKLCGHSRDSAGHSRRRFFYGILGGSIVQLRGSF